VPGLGGGEQAEENRANFHAIGLQEAIADCQASMRALRRAAL
jgi:hypothetical protein